MNSKPTQISKNFTYYQLTTDNLEFICDWINSFQYTMAVPTKTGLIYAYKSSVNHADFSNYMIHTPETAPGIPNLFPFSVMTEKEFSVHTTI